jgi:hypothetical protein
MEELEAAGMIPHEWTTINIGEGAYRFRTLSIKQVFACQDELRTMFKHLAAKSREELSALTKEEKLEVVAAQRKLLGTISPLLIQIKNNCSVEGCDTAEPHADYLHLTGSALSEILAFYKRQNWKKIDEMLSIGDNGSKPNTRTESEKTFRFVGRRVSKAYGHSFDDFLALRFEEAASRVIELAEAAVKKNDEGKTSLEDFFDSMAGEMGLVLVEGEAPVLTEAPGSDFPVLMIPPIN